ncbi:hypothetical protein [uncultured Pseudokineococcus sp.]|uniref:hypothetical protein n=1 Tax=uncultured Pseudokineococcus sp. TaxID=1642928 RepID=UPI00261E8E72|nr:hypothetical protein [uncultured Pseudokineococcus sp.]
MVSSGAGRGVGPGAGGATGPGGDLLTEVLGPGRSAGGGLAVRGGAGGLVADGREMGAAADALRRVGLSLGERAAEVGLVVARTGLTGAPALDPAGAAAVARALAAAVGAGGAAGTAAACGELAARLALAGAAYEEAERVAQRVVAGVRDGVARAAGGALGALVRRPEVVLPAGAVVLVAVSGASLTWVVVRGGGLLGDLGDRAVGALADGRVDAAERTALVAGTTDLPGELEVLARADAGGAARALAAEASLLAAQHPQLLQHVVAAAPALAGAALPLRAGGTDRGAVWAGGDRGAVWTGGDRGAVSSGGRRGGGASTGGRGAVALPGGDRWAWPPRDVADLAAAVAVVGTQDGALRPTRVDVRAAGPAVPVAPARGTADLLARARPMAGGGALSPGGRATSRAPVHVERVVDAAGARRWVVVLPPTQTTAAPWARATTNPADLGTDVRAVGQVPTAATRAAVTAMQRAGVRPGEPVLLVGYSQGGLTAVQLAADPALRERVTVDAVLTAGAPVGGFDLPPDVAVLSLEHEEDWIASLDGGANPATPAWSTVVRDLPPGATAPAPGEAPDGMAGHGLDHYGETADLVDASDDASLVAWRERAAPYLAAEGTTASAQLFLAERRPVG